MQKTSFNKIIWLLFYLLVFIFLLNHSYAYLDADLGWHLKIGQDILTEKQVPSINYYNYPLLGENWMDHEWLSNLMIYWLYDNYGYLSLSLFFTLLITLTLIIQAVFIKKLVNGEKNINFFIIVFQAIGIIGMGPHLGVRIQEITILNLLLLLIIINKYEKTKNYRILYFLLPLFYFWTCLHGGFLIGLFILFFYLAIKLLEKVIKKYKHFDFINFASLLKKKAMAIFALFSFLSILITLITPYGIKFYSFLSDYKNTYYLKHIQEWLPVNTLPIQYWQLLYSALVVTGIFIMLFSFFNNKKHNNDDPKNKINLWYLALSLFFLVLAFKSKRNFPLLYIVSFPLLIQSYAQNFIISENNIFQKFTKKLKYFLKSLIIICLLLLIFYFSSTIYFTEKPFVSYCHNYPCQAVQFLQANPQYGKLRLFNQFGWGGYLLWTWPDKLLFIDGRFPQYQFSQKHTFLEEYFELFEEEKLEEKLNQYNIELVLIKTKDEYRKLNWFEKYFLMMNEEEINQRENHLNDYLKDSKSWQRIFKNDLSIIYVKN